MNGAHRSSQRPSGTARPRTARAREIERATAEPGAQLPSESQLMAEYDVSRVTARRALGVLVTDGLVVAEHGRGRFVRRPPR